LEERACEHGGERQLGHARPRRVCEARVLVQGAEGVELVEGARDEARGWGREVVEADDVGDA
jgi:hypothetical protein